MEGAGLRVKNGECRIKSEELRVGGQKLKVEQEGFLRCQTPTSTVRLKVCGE